MDDHISGDAERKRDAHGAQNPASDRIGPVVHVSS
jgi:hypothetical protein